MVKYILCTTFTDVIIVGSCLFLNDLAAPHRRRRLPPLFPAGSCAALPACLGATLATRAPAKSKRKKQKEEPASNQREGKSSLLRFVNEGEFLRFVNAGESPHRGAAWDSLICFKSYKLR